MAFQILVGDDVYLQGVPPDFLSGSMNPGLTLVVHGIQNLSANLDGSGYWALVEEWDGLVVYYDCPISCGDVPWPGKICFSF